MSTDESIYIEPSQLTDTDRATLKYNHTQLQRVVDRLTAIIIEHRKGGCHDWYCAPSTVTDIICALSERQLQSLLAYTIDRLAEEMMNK